MAHIAAENAQYPIIKLKLGSDDDIARVAAVRAARPDTRIYVDANAAWSPKEAVRQVKALAPYNLEMIEQPVAKEDIEGMGYVQAHTEIPIVADESVRSLADIEASGCRRCERHQSQTDEGRWFDSRVGNASAWQRVRAKDHAWLYV